MKIQHFAKNGQKIPVYGTQKPVPMTQFSVYSTKKTDLHILINAQKKLVKHGYVPEYRTARLFTEKEIVLPHSTGEVQSDIQNHFFILRYEINILTIVSIWKPENTSS